MNFLQLLESFKEYINKKPVFYETSDKCFSADERKDIREWKNLRFIYIASKNPILYVFPSDLLHMNVADKFGFHYMEYWKNTTPIFFGEGKCLAGKIVYNGSYEFDLMTSHSKYNLGDGLFEKANDYLKKLSKANWSLALKCISGIDKVIEQIKKMAEEE